MSSYLDKIIPSAITKKDDGNRYIFPTDSPYFSTKDDAYIFPKGSDEMSNPPEAVTLPDYESMKFNVGRAGNSDAIAELDKQIAELESQIASFDLEDKMARYKYQYESDVQPYMNLQQQKRMKEATDKANSDANIISSYKTLANDLEIEKYNLQEAELAVKNIKNDTSMSGADKSEALEKANLNLNRARSLYNRKEKALKEVSAKAAKVMGLSVEEPEEVVDGYVEEVKPEVAPSVPEEAPRTNTDIIDLQSNIENLFAGQVSYDEMKKKPMSSTNIDKVYKQRLAELNKVKPNKADGDANYEKQLAAWNKQKAELDNWKRTQPKPVVKDKAYWENLKYPALNNRTIGQLDDEDLKKVPPKDIIDAKKAGIKNGFFDEVIEYNKIHGVK